MNLIPYTKVDGQRNFKDSEIMSLYDRMVSEGTADTVFQDGSINNSWDFLNEMKCRSQFYVLVDSDPVAIVWLNRFEGRTARLHFCFFQKIWGEQSIEAGRFICRELLSYQNKDGRYFLDSLIGRIPASNTLAINFFKKVGVQFVGEIPEGHLNAKTNQSECCHIVYVNRRCIDGWR